jgi:hypothetical protein
MGEWTRRDSVRICDLDRVLCCDCNPGPERSLCDGGEGGKKGISYFIARVPNWEAAISAAEMRTREGCGRLSFVGREKTIAEGIILYIAK